MEDYTIENFWKIRLSGKRGFQTKPVQGWQQNLESLPAFMEAPLQRNTDFTEKADPHTSPIVLVSAPGAVGKSTLARQIANATGAIYIDLAQAEPVGGNTLSGGILKSGLHQVWQDEQVTVLIDGLDEARFRVTQDAYNAFIKDIAELASSRNMPIVLFGRTGAVQETWLELASSKVEVAILEIGYFDSERSIEFSFAKLYAQTSDRNHQAAQKRAIELLLKGIRQQTQTDGDRFAGYAPVLQAVAERVAREANPSAFVASIEKGDQRITLKSVAEAILEREHRKLEQLDLEDNTLKATLYQPTEQLTRLASRVYNVPPPNVTSMSARDAKLYTQALETWLPDHPFLGTGTVASSVVFEAMIASHALRLGIDSAAQGELQRGVAGNPFLAEFYIGDNSDTRLRIPPEHIGIVYASMRAQLSLGDSASLIVEANDDADNDDLLANVEITLARKGSDKERVLEFETEQTGVLRLGNYVEDVDVSAPYSNVEIGPGTEAILIAPISVQCAKLTILARTVIVESTNGSGSNVYLEATEFEGEQVASAPTVRNNAKFSVSWPNANRYPWTSFATTPTEIADPRTDEALRRFRKFIMCFRSHSKGALGRYRGKIEHERMTKGSGDAVLRLLIREKIMTLKGVQYFLDPDRLGALSGATYASVSAKHFSPETIAFVQSALR